VPRTLCNARLSMCFAEALINEMIGEASDLVRAAFARHRSSGRAAAHQRERRRGLRRL
jgi:hypothetical protein